MARADRVLISNSITDVNEGSEAGYDVVIRRGRNIVTYDGI